MALKNQKLDDYLTEQNLEQQFNGGKTSKKVKKEKVKKEKVKKEKVKKTKNKKGTAKRVAAFVIAIALAVTAFVSCSIIKKNKNKTNTTPRHPSITQEDNTNNIDNNIENNKNDEINNSLKDLGVSLDFPEVQTKPQYENPSNDKINTDKIVEDNNGTLWIDEEAKEESTNIGKVEIDTKDDTLVVKPDGNVYEKEEGFEIKNEKDEVVSSGNVNEYGIPEGYVKDPTTGDYYKENDVYIDPEGNAWESKERYEAYLESLKNDGETVDTEFVPVEDDKNSENIDESDKTEEDVTIEQITEEGVINQDGTYTIYGTTYESKADFEQFLLTPEEYGYYNGMIVSLEKIEEINKQLILK